MASPGLLSKVLISSPFPSSRASLTPFRSQSHLEASSKTRYSVSLFLPSRSSISFANRSKATPRRFIAVIRASASPLPAALLFDCDGVLVDTEKDGHRISFNDTFAEVLTFILTFVVIL
jgi:hypothetical protein